MTSLWRPPAAGSRLAQLQLHFLTLRDYVQSPCDDETRRNAARVQRREFCTLRGARLLVFFARCVRGTLTSRRRSNEVLYNMWDTRVFRVLSSQHGRSFVFEERSVAGDVLAHLHTIILLPG